MSNIKKLESISKVNEYTMFEFLFHLTPFFSLPLAYYGFHVPDINLLNLFLYGSETSFDKFFNGLMLFVIASLILYSIIVMVNLIYFFLKLNINLNNQLRKDFIFKARTSKKVEQIICKMSLQEIKDLKEMDKADYFYGFYNNTIVPILIKHGHD